MKRIEQEIARALATVLYIGYLRPGPGTWGSLPGLALGWWLYTLHLQPLTLLLVFTLASFVAVGIIAVAERSMGHDNKHIVIDEVIGQAIAIAWFAPSPATLVLGFALFRLFDIWKPGPIGWADRRIHHPAGTLVDDLLAGFVAAAILWAYSLRA